MEDELVVMSDYIKQLIKFGLSASLALGVLVAVLLLIAGGTTAGIDLTFDFGAFDGFWLLIGLPVITTVVLLLVSPLSFWIHRFLNQLLGKQSRDKV